MVAISGLNLTNGMDIYDECSDCSSANFIVKKGYESEFPRRLKNCNVV